MEMGRKGVGEKEGNGGERMIKREMNGDEERVERKGWGSKGGRGSRCRKRGGIIKRRKG